MTYIPRKYITNKALGPWLWWTWKHYNWHFMTVQTGFRVFGLEFYGPKRSLN